MKHATSIALHGYWQSCHDASGVPAGGIRAAELAPILPSLFLIDLTAHTGACFRYCGGAMALRYGRDLTDESFLTFWTLTIVNTPNASSERWRSTRPAGRGVTGETSAADSRL